MLGWVGRMGRMDDSHVCMCVKMKNEKTRKSLQEFMIMIIKEVRKPSQPNLNEFPINQSKKRFCQIKYILKYMDMGGFSFLGLGISV